MTQLAHRCQRCGDTFHPGDKRRWCNACEPTAVVKRRSRDLDVESIARNLVRDGLASPMILGATYPGRTRSMSRPHTTAERDE